MKRRILGTQRGMSLIEILIVISLIAMVGTFVVGRLLDQMSEGSVKSAAIQIKNFGSLLEEYRRFCFNYPTTDQGLDALVAKPTTPPDCANYPANGIMGGQSGKIPQDPWGTEYDYNSDGKTYLITSYGSDKAEGGDGFAKDLKSNEI